MMKTTGSTLLFPRSFQYVERFVNTVSISIVIYYFSPWNKSLSFLKMLILSQGLLKLQYLFFPIHDYWSGRTLNPLEKLVLVGVQRFIEFWHGFEIHGMEKIRDIKGGRLLLGYHTRNSVDLMYLISAIKPVILVSVLFFKVPINKHLLPFIGFMPSKNETSFVDALLESDKKPVMLLPGGVFECFKPYDEQYRVTWKSVPGYARIIFEQKEKFKEKGMSVIPFYTKNCERIYYQSPSWYEKTGKMARELYHRFRNGEMLMMCQTLTVSLFSWGFGVLPVPVKLDTYFGKPISCKDDETVEQFSYRIHKHLEQIIEIVNDSDDPEVIKAKISELDENDSDPNKKDTLTTKHTAEEHLQYVEKVNQCHFEKDFAHHLPYKYNPFYLVYGMFIAIISAIQNSILYILFLSLIWVAYPPMLVYVTAVKSAKILGLVKPNTIPSKKRD
jgi:hypothetical protein